MALLISHDSIVGEVERGTMALLLSYPVGRRQVILGKFLGRVLILLFATVVGYGAAAVALALAGVDILMQRNRQTKIYADRWTTDRLIRS